MTKFSKNNSLFIAALFLLFLALPSNSAIACTSDTDCSGADTCQGSDCLPTACTGDTGCPATQYCEGGTCSLDHGTGDLCNRPEQCAPPLFCTAGECSSTPTPPSGDCSGTHSGWSCQDPAARGGLSEAPCDTAISCPTSGNKCCPPVAVQSDARTAYEEGRTKESAGDAAGACEAFRRAQSLLPSSAAESAITRVCAAAPSAGGSASATRPTPATINSPIAATSVQQLIGSIIQTVLGLVGALALIMFIYGGFTWLTSGGSADKITKGRNILMWATIGLAVIFASYSLVDLVLRALGV